MNVGTSSLELKHEISSREWTAFSLSLIGSLFLPSSLSFFFFGIWNFPSLTIFGELIATPVFCSNYCGDPIVLGTLSFLVLLTGVAGVGYSLFFTRKLVRYGRRRMATWIRAFVISNLVLGWVAFVLFGFFLEFLFMSVSP